MSDNVYHPNHYVLNSVKLEPVELTARLPSAVGQAINYVMRCRFKGTRDEDIEKAINYLRIQLNMKDMFKQVGDERILYHFNADTNKVRVAVVWAFRNYYIAPYPEGTDPCDRMEDLFLRILIDDNYNITAKSIEKAIEFLTDVRDGIYDNLAIDEEEMVQAGGTE
jgi:hypothetical protein